MKINRLETHDRLIHLKKDQSNSIQQGCDDCLKKNPLSLAYQARSPYIYIYAHARTSEDGVTKRMLWQPRLSKPKAELNSYLFRAQSNTDVMEICWILPDETVVDQFKEGNVVEDELIQWSITMFKTNREALEKPFPDDLSEERATQIIREVINEHQQDLRMKKMYVKPTTSELYLPSY